MASGHPNPEGPRPNCIHPSVVHNLDRRDKKLISGQERIVHAQCVWFWPVLEPLWNPPSREFWIEKLRMLQDVQDAGRLKVPILATLLLSTARHGEAVLLGSKTLRELVMDNFLHPLNPTKWEAIKQMSESNLKDYIRKRDSARSRCAWKPWKYDKTMEKSHCERSSINQQLEELGNKMPEQTRIEESEPFKFLERLFGKTKVERLYRKAQSSSSKVRLLSFEFDIALEPIGSAAARETECPICRELLLDHEDIYEIILKAASKRPALAPCISTKLAHPGPSTKDLEEARNLTRCPHAFPDHAVERDPNWLVKCLSDSCDDLKKIMEEPKCVQAIKLRCGHTFGLDCIEEWFSEDNSTCPICRAQLAPGRRHRRGRDVVMIDPGDGGPLEEGIMVDHPFDEEEVGPAVSNTMNAIIPQEVIHRNINRIGNRQNMEAPLMSPAEVYSALTTLHASQAISNIMQREDPGPENLRPFDRIRPAVEGIAINRRPLIEIESNNDGSTPRPIYDSGDSRTQNYMEVANLSSPASEVSEPNPITPLREMSTDTILGYVWPESPDLDGIETPDVPGEEIRFQSPRNATNEELDFPLFSPSPSPTPSASDEGVQERVLPLRRRRRTADFERDVEVTNQDRPSRRQRIDTEW